MEKQTDFNLTFVWILKNFSMCHHIKGTFLVSPPFIFDSLPGMKWHILLYPEGKSAKNYVDIFLCRNDDIPEDCKLTYTFQFLDCNEKEIPADYQTLTTLFEKGKPNWRYGLPRIIARNLLLRSIISDILIIKCRLKPVSETDEKLIYPSLSYKSGLFTDVVLRARGAEFKVNKAILWARWPELAKKLDEQTSSEQDFDIRSNVLEAMIKYVYTGKLNFSGYVLSFEEVYVTAAKYGLRILSPTPGSIKTCETRIHTEKISFVWPIENFSSLPVNTELYHEFQIDIPEFNKWSLRVHISEKTETDQIFGIFICKIPDRKPEPIFVRARISFDEANSAENEHSFKQDENWKCAEFSRNISTDPDDILLLRCEFKLSNGSVSSEIVESSCVFASSIGDSNLNKSLRNIYENGTLSDVTVVADSRRFSVHKFILCSQSSVFCKMFETEMIESANDEVQISDVDPDIMHEMLLFLYTGNVGTLCEESAMQLYTAADKYGVDALKKKCSSFLKSNITVENVCKILQLAHMHCNDDLYQRALEVFSDHLQEIYSTDEWKTMSNKKFCVKLLQDVIARNKPKK